MLILKRIYANNYTRGVLNIPDVCKLDVLELTYKNNRQNVSCIPENKYIIKCHNSPKFGKCLKVYEPLYDTYWNLTKEEQNNNTRETKLIEVKGRSDILIHSGNAVKDFSFHNNLNQLTTYSCDSRGCLLVGFGFFKVKDTDDKEQAYITGSRKGLTFLFNYVKSRGGFVDLLITSGEEEQTPLTPLTKGGSPKDRGFIPLTKVVVDEVNKGLNY